MKRASIVIGGRVVCVFVFKDEMELYTRIFMGIREWSRSYPEKILTQFTVEFN